MRTSFDRYSGNCCRIDVVRCYPSRRTLQELGARDEARCTEQRRRFR